MSINNACGDPGVFGLSSQYLTAGTGRTISSSGTWQGIELDLLNDKNFQKLNARLAAIEERLAILDPNEDLQKRFPALQEAYDHYKLIEKLVDDGKK